MTTKAKRKADSLTYLLDNSRFTNEHREQAIECFREIGEQLQAGQQALDLLRKLAKHRSGPTSARRGEWIDTMLEYSEEARNILRNPT